MEAMVPGQVVAFAIELVQPLSRSALRGLHDIPERSNTEIKGAVMTRLMQRVLRHVSTNQPVERLRELVGLIAHP